MRTRAPDTLYIRAPKLNQLYILNQLGSNPRLTQAELARRCDLSVAMVNNYMKELCSTGHLEYHRKSTKSVSYHLTARGEELVSTIEQELLSELVELFAQAKERIRTLILSQASGMPHRVILYGTGHLAEMAFHALEPTDISVIGICDDDRNSIGREWCGREMLNPSQIRYMAPDAVIIADCCRTEEICRGLQCLQERGIRLIRLDHQSLDPILKARRAALGDSPGAAIHSNNGR